VKQQIKKRTRIDSVKQVLAVLPGL